MRTDYLKLQHVWESTILSTYLQATASQIAEGKQWYPLASETLDAMQDASVLVRQRIAAICAVLSPRVAWKTNVEATRKMVRASSQGLRICPTIAGVRRNVDKAWIIANGGSLELVSGPKVSSFYANLCGDYQRVTCDTWAARAAGIPDEQHSHLDRNRYRHLEMAYQRVSAELGFLPAELQAICWIVVRGKGE